MKSKRFSKAALLAHINERVETLQKQHKLDAGNGWAQVQGKDVARTVAYGEFRGLLDLARDIKEGYL